MTIKDIHDLIYGDEGRILELKKTTGELKDGMKSACAFLNTDGGWVIFGITPTSLKIVGQQVTDNTKKEIGQEIAKLYPAIDLKPIYVPVPDKPDFYVIALHLKSTILRDIKELNAQGVLAWVGSKKGGHWEIKE